MRQMRLEPRINGQKRENILLNFLSCVPGTTFSSLVMAIGKVSFRNVIPFDFIANSFLYRVQFERVQYCNAYVVMQYIKIFLFAIKILIDNTQLSLNSTTFSLYFMIVFRLFDAFSLSLPSSLIRSPFQFRKTQTCSMHYSDRNRNFVAIERNSQGI